MQRGSSGAGFNFLGDRVVKVAPAKGALNDSAGQRVMNQGLWLQKHQSPAVPRVFQVYARSYVMERLTAPPFWALDHQVVLRHMYVQLVEHVWSQPAEVACDMDDTEVKYVMLCEQFQLHDICSKLDKLVDAIKWGDLRPCLTHGDPTFDNVMFRDTDYGGDLVVADPIPATTAVPDLLSVDIGKMLQSALGWEEIRYGSRAFKFRAGTLDVLGMLGDDKNERRAAAFWGAVHILRTFPYVSPDLHNKLKERVNAAIRLGL